MTHYCSFLKFLFLLTSTNSSSSFLKSIMNKLHENTLQLSVLSGPMGRETICHCQYFQRVSLLMLPDKFTCTLLKNELTVLPYRCYRDSFSHQHFSHVLYYIIFVKETKMDPRSVFFLSEETEQMECFMPFPVNPHMSRRYEMLRCALVFY